MHDYKYDVTIKAKITETSEAYSFVLQVSDKDKQHFHYKPGQFITLFLTIDGQEYPRSYSFSSSPISNKDLKITVKRVENGLASNYLIDKVKVGDSLKASTPAGHFFNMSQTIEDQLEYIMFAAGSGVTPIMSMIKWSLPHLPKHSIHLVYSNKNPESTIFLDELNALENKYQHFKVTYLYSRLEEKSQKLTVNELNILLDEAFLTPLQKSIYMCGPEAYMNMISEGAIARGLTTQWLHKESFFMPVDDGSAAAAGIEHGIFIGEIPSNVVAQPCETVIAEIDGEYVEAKGNSEEPLLEILLEQGHAPPFSCMSGSCQACLCELVEGKVYQEYEGILTEEEVENKQFLSCQAKAISKTVKFKYIE